MLIIICYFIINIIILAFMLIYIACGSTFLISKNWLSLMSVEDMIIVAVLLESIITAIGASGVGVYLLRRYDHVRQSTNQELVRIEPLIAAVVAKYNTLLNTHYNRDSFILNISDSKYPNTYVYGQKYLIITTGLLAIMSDDELKALLTNQFGHIRHYDGTYVTVKIFTNIPLILSTWLFRLLRSIFSSLAKFNQLLLICSVICGLILLPIALLSEFARRVLLVVDTLISKQRVYRADSFASQLGYKNDLISALNKLALVEGKADNIFQYLFASKPSSKLRITKLQSTIR